MSTIITDTGAHQEGVMSDRQRDYLNTLLDRKYVSAVMAARFIAELVQCPDLGASGLDDVQERIDATNT